MTIRKHLPRNGGPGAVAFSRARDRRHFSSNLPKCFTIKAVAEALDVSSRTVRRWIARGELAVHRWDGVVRIAEGDLKSFLALHRED
jgi:excisionase family DNA binding protein